MGGGPDSFHKAKNFKILDLTNDKQQQNQAGLEPNINI